VIVLLESGAWVMDITSWLPRKPGWSVQGAWVSTFGTAIRRASEQGGMVAVPPGTNAWLRMSNYRNGPRPQLTCGAAFRVNPAITQPGMLMGWLSGSVLYAYLTLEPGPDSLRSYLRLYRYAPGSGTSQRVAEARVPWHWISDHYLEAQIQAGANGGVVVRLDGRDVLRWRGDPGGLGSPPPTAYDTVQWGGPIPGGGSGTLPFSIACIYFVDDIGTAPLQPTGFLGPCVVAYRPPSALVSGGWTVVGAADGLAAVAESFFLDLAGYITSSNSTALNTYDWRGLIGGTPYFAAQLHAVCTAADAGAQLAVAYNGTELWTQLVPQGTYGVATIPWAFEPTTGAPWTGLRLGSGQVRLRNRFGSADFRVAQLGFEVAYAWNPPHTRRPWVVQVNWADAPESDPLRWDHPLGEILTERLQRIEIERDLAYPQVQVDTCTITTEDPDWVVVPGRKESPLFGAVRFGAKARIWVHGPQRPVMQFYGEITDYQIALDGPPWRLVVRVESPLRQVLQTQVDIGQWRTGQYVMNYFIGGDEPTYDRSAALMRLLNAAGIARIRILVPISTFPKDWSGRGTFGALLAELMQLMRWAAWVEPMDGATGSDWRLVVQPANRNAPPMATWDWKQGALHPTPQVDYGGEIP
jgi:hypothetical protein